MPSRRLAGLTVHFDRADAGSAGLVAEACRRTVELARLHWGLSLPGGCQVHLMTGWLSFAFHAAPWHWLPYLVLTLPFWARREAGVWPYAGGWAQRFGRRRAVGVKPPRLLALSDRSLGAGLFESEEDLEQKVQQIACHELMHAHTDHLKLPTWLHEGLAMVTVDLFAGRRTVKQETLGLLDSDDVECVRGRGYPGAARDPEGLVRLYARGYWVTRYLAATCPADLRKVLAKPLRAQELEGMLAAALGLERGSFWRELLPRVRQSYLWNAALGASLNTGAGETEKG